VSAAWHVVHTRPNDEERVVQNLVRQEFETFLPLYRRRIRHARRIETSTRPLFPRYLFVRFDPDIVRWRSINGTRGVVRLLCQDERPMAVPQGIVEAIRGRVDEAGFVRIDAARHFMSGQRILITDGAFAHSTGLFQQMTDNERVILLLDLLGRQVRVSVSAEVVAAA